MLGIVADVESHADQTDQRHQQQHEQHQNNRAIQHLVQLGPLHACLDVVLHQLRLFARKQHQSICVSIPAHRQTNKQKNKRKLLGSNELAASIQNVAVVERRLGAVRHDQRAGEAVEILVHALAFHLSAKQKLRQTNARKQARTKQPWP